MLCCSVLTASWHFHLSDTPQPHFKKVHLVHCSSGLPTNYNNKKRKTLFLISQLCSFLFSLGVGQDKVVLFDTVSAKHVYDRTRNKNITKRIKANLIKVTFASKGSSSINAAFLSVLQKAIQRPRTLWIYF